MIGIHKDEYFTNINFVRTWHQSDPFILVSQAKQIIYLKDTRYKDEWHVVQSIAPKGVYDINVHSEIDVDEDFLQEEQNTADLGQYSIDIGSTSPLIRDDMQPDNIDVSKLNLNMSEDDDDNDNNFINDGEEDYTLMNYDDKDVDNPPDQNTNIE